MPSQAFRQIEVSESTFERLQKLAKPLVDTTDSVIALLIDYYHGKQKITPAGSANAFPAPTTKVFDCRDAPNLTHTKVLGAKINGKVLGSANWNNLLSDAVTLAASQCKTDDDLRRAVIINFVRGRKEDSGYHFIPKANLSIQGQSAVDAWKATWHIVKLFHIPIEVDFIWHNKPEAAFPGEAGRFVWK